MASTTATVTASLATGYVPPFASAAKTTSTGIVFASQGTLSYGGGSTATSTAAIVDSTGGVDSSSLTAYFFIPYVEAHSLSVPTWRYAYMLWIILLGVLVFWSIGYHFGGTNTGLVGGWFRKWSIRRVVFGGKVKEVERGGGKVTVTRKKSWTTPTIAQMLAVIGLIGLCVCLSLLGDDYLAPTTCTFGGRCQYNSGSNSGPPRSTYRAKRANVARQPSLNLEVAAPRPAALPRSLISRGVNNPNGWAPFNDPLLAGPNYAISANLWASSGRLGLISYAMIPLVVTLAVKQWPFNIWASPFLIGYHFDKGGETHFSFSTTWKLIVDYHPQTAILHRWSGRVIWLFSTAHTLTWGAQLLKDKDPFGRPTLIPAFKYWRFLAGIAAYGVLTLMVILSLSSFRNRYYELFWWSHALLTIGFCVGCIMHSRNLMWWPVAGLALWGAERLCRLTVLVWINKLGFNKKPQTGNRGSFSVIRSEKEPRYSEGKEAHHDSSAYPPTPHYPQASWERERASGNGFSREFDNDSSYSLNASHPSQSRPPAYASPPASPFPPPRHSAASSHYPEPERNVESYRPPPGYANAQLLPGSTVRLTISTPKPVRWLPGQHVFLTLPGVKFGALQSHPYTITSVDDRTAGVAPIGGAPLVNEGSNVVLLIRAQQGFSKSLWDHVVEKRRAKEAAGASPLQICRGVNLRALIGWPLGSSGRIKWRNYDSVLIICGGTGVTFGVSVLEYLCRRMARREPTVGKKSFKATRVRFVWILREYAHLSWVAPTIRRCLEMSRAGQLSVDLYVSRDQAPSRGPTRPSTPHRPPFSAHPSERDAFVPPVAPFAQEGKFGSRDSLSGELSDTEEELAVPQQYREADQNIDSITDLVLFDGEDDSPSPGELDISSTIRKEGKVRRALSRRQPGRSAPPPPSRPTHSRGSTADYDHEGREQDIGYGRRYPPSSPSQYRLPTSPYKSTGSFVDTGSMAELGLDFDARSFGGASSVRPLVGAQSHSQLVNDALGAESTYLDVTPEDREGLDILSELARPGHPQLDKIMDDEISGSAGRTMVACCGPTSLNTVVRHLVSNRINLRKVMKGDPHGDVSLICEDFSF